MKCTDKRCLSPTACQGFGYCRNLNRPFQVTRLFVPPIFHTQLTGEGAEFRTIEISARNKAAAERIADQNLDWFSDRNALVATTPAN